MRYTSPVLANFERGLLQINGANQKFHGSHRRFLISHHSTISHNLINRAQLFIMLNLVQCNICQKWYSNQRGLLIHLGFCRQRHASEQNDKNHLLLGQNTLKSCYNQGDHRNPFAVYDNDLDSSSMKIQLAKIKLTRGVGGGI